MIHREIWKPVKGYEGSYEVSSFGRVRSVDLRRGGGYKILQQTTTEAGKTVYLNLNKYFVHTLVAEAFIYNHFNAKVVKHRSGWKLNNHVENLRWAGSDIIPSSLIPI